jgi:hypothetical protein
MNVRTLSKEESSEIERLSNLAQIRLGINNINDFPNVLNKIKELVDQIREKDEEDVNSIAYELGSLYGTVIQKKYNWKWIYLEKEDLQVYCICSTNDKFCCPVHNYLYSLLTTQKRNNVKLLFNMIEDIHKEKVTDKYTFIN